VTSVSATKDPALKMMRAKFLVLIISLIFSVTMFNWLRLEQFLTVSPLLFTPDRQTNELHQKREDKIFVENIENSQNSVGQGERKTQEDEVIVREEEEEEEGGLLHWMHKQQERKASLAAACARNPRWKESVNTRSPNGAFKMFAFNRQHRLLTCLQPKVASTSLHKHLVDAAPPHLKIQLEPLSRREQALLLAPTDRDIITLAASSTSFTMVRHPFERLASAFQDKVANGDKSKWLGKITTGLLKQLFGDDSFPSFVKMLTMENRQAVGRALCPRNDSFAEIKTEPCTENYHWASLQNRCFHCATPYTAIAKFETYDEDLKYIGLLANMTFDTGVRENAQEEKTSRLAASMFKQLKKREVENLYKLYAADFEMFGYSAAEYINVAQPD